MSTPTTTHPVTPEELMALLDGELAADRAQSVSAHTESCSECQQAFAATLRTSSYLSAWTAGEAASEIETSIHASSERIASEARSRGPRRFSVARNRWALGLAACAGALLLIAVSASILNRPAMMKFHADVPRERVRVETLPLNGREGDQLLAIPPGAAKNTTATATRGEREFSKLQVYAKLEHAQQSVPVGPMIARTVSLAILVKDFDASRKSLDGILARCNGYAANLSVSTPQGAGRSIQASLRIPAPQLAPALAELKALGHVENENQSGEEVTQQHADLVARLKNSRETEQRLQAILTQRTGKISDVLEVEQEIARVRGEIEEMEAEQKNLEHRVDFATVELKISEEYKVKLDSSVPSFSTEFHNALVNGYRNVADTVAALLLFFAEYGPVLLLWAVLLSIPSWLVWRRWRHIANPAM